MDNNKNVVVENQEQQNIVESVVEKQDVGKEEDAILAFIEQRAQRYLELDVTLEEIAEQKAKEKELQKKRKP